MSWETLPILAVFGDYRDTATGLPTLPTWQARFEGCQTFVDRIKKAGGQAEMRRQNAASAATVT